MTCPAVSKGAGLIGAGKVDLTGESLHGADRSRCCVAVLHLQIT